MRPNRALISGALCVALLAFGASGCARRGGTLADAFPRAAVAAPWVLDGGVWSGTLDEAGPALGDEQAAWAEFQPTRVWLAVYRHDGRPDRKMTLRVLAFDAPQAARAAYLRFRPPDAPPFAAGDEGCWSGVGVLFYRGRLVVDIFGGSAGWQSEVEAARFAGYLQKHMAPGLSDAPR